MFCTGLLGQQEGIEQERQRKTSSETNEKVAKKWSDHSYPWQSLKMVVARDEFGIVSARGGVDYRVDCSQAGLEPEVGCS
jgi:hypothetical protein